MSESDVSESLREFLSSFVHTFEELDVLLVLRRSAPRAVAPEDFEHYLGLPPDVALSALEALAGRGLLRREPGARRAFVFAPDPGLAPRVAELARAQEEQHFALVEVMSANAIERLKSSAVKTFSEAFLLGRRARKDR